MKITNTIRIAIGLSIALSMSIVAEERAPSFREFGNWIVIASQENALCGNLPTSNAIRKDTILSISIRSDFDAMKPDGESTTFTKYAKYSDEDRQALPAVVEITTSELVSQNGSGIRIYQILGFTHATAKIFLEKVVALLTKPSEAKAAE